MMKNTKSDIQVLKPFSQAQTEVAGQFLELVFPVVVTTSDSSTLRCVVFVLAGLKTVPLDIILLITFLVEIFMKNLRKAFSALEKFKLQPMKFSTKLLRRAVSARLSLNLKSRCASALSSRTQLLWRIE